jgi:transcriptional regulator with XRE-family HTH domain
VRLWRKRYHRVYTLQTQGQMHVQMKVSCARACGGGEPAGEAASAADQGVVVLSAQPGSGPTVLRILLGSQLRRLREAKGISREDAGYAIRGSGSKISRMELGRVSFKERDVVDLLAMYGVSGEEADALVALAREANSPGWWHNYGDVLPEWFQVYVGLEEAASLIRLYEVQFVPGLLQTPDYARAVVELGQPSAVPEEVERRVSLRMARQELLHKAGGPRLWAVIDEAALRRPIGGQEVMRGQFDRLIEATREPNITLQVVPFQSGGHAAEAGAFTIMRFPETDLPDVVYLEHLTSALYLDKREDVERYTEVMERLSVEGESPERTAEILSGMLEEATGA